MAALNHEPPQSAHDLAGAPKHYLFLFGKCLNGIFAAAAQHQDKHTARDGEVLLEM